MKAESEKNKQKSAGSIIKKILADFKNLFLLHIELVKAETKEEAYITIKIVLLIVTGILCAYNGIIFSGIFLIFFLSHS